MPVALAPDIGPAKDRDQGVNRTFVIGSMDGEFTGQGGRPAIFEFRRQVDVCACLRHAFFNDETGVEDRPRVADRAQPPRVCMREDRRNEFEAVC